MRMLDIFRLIINYCSLLYTESLYNNILIFKIFFVLLMLNVYYFEKIAANILPTRLEMCYNLHTINN